MRTPIHRSSALRASIDACGTGIHADAGMLVESSIFGQNIRLVQCPPKQSCGKLTTMKNGPLTGLLTGWSLVK